MTTRRSSLLPRRAGVVRDLRVDEDADTPVDAGQDDGEDHRTGAHGRVDHPDRDGASAPKNE